MLTERTRQFLLRDYDQVNAEIKSILENPETNYEIVDKHYSEPRVIFSNKLALSDEKGSFRHYCNVRDIVIVALAIGKIPRHLYKLHRGPSYLEELVE